MCLGVPGRVVEITDVSDQRAVADVEGVRREISLALLGVRTGPDEVVAIGNATGEEAVSVGDWVLIHVGFAMSRIDEAEAEETLRALKLFSGAFDEEMAEFAADGGIDPFDLLRPPAARLEPPR